MPGSSKYKFRLGKFCLSQTVLGVQIDQVIATTAIGAACPITSSRLARGVAATNWYEDCGMPCLALVIFARHRTCSTGGPVFDTLPVALSERRKMEDNRRAAVEKQKVQLFERSNLNLRKSFLGRRFGSLRKL